MSSGGTKPPSHSKETPCLTVPPGSMLLHLLCLLPTTFCSLFKVHILKGSIFLALSPRPVGVDLGKQMHQKSTQIGPLGLSTGIVRPCQSD